MSRKKFDPKKFKGKKTIYVSLPQYPGVSHIWDWSPRRKQYCKRTLGNKFYAAKRVEGRQVTKCFDSLNEANKWRYLDDLGILDEDILFKDVLKLYFEKKKSELRISTFETYQSKSKHLKFFMNLRVLSITAKTIDEWLIKIKKPSYLSNQHTTRLSYRHELDVLRQVLDYFREYMYEGNDYALPIKKRHRKDMIVDQTKFQQHKAKNKTKYLSRKEVLSFLKQLQLRSIRKPDQEVYYLLALFQFSTGTRIGEASAIMWKDINLKSGEVLIAKTVCWSRKKGRETYISDLTKTGESRVVFLPKEVIQVLRKWHLKSGCSKGLVFSFDGITPLKFRSISYYYGKALEAIGAEWRGTHIMRHSFATDFLEKTQNPKALQGLLGHQTAQQTNHYAKITKTLIRSGVEAYENSFSGVVESM